MAFRFGFGTLEPCKIASEVCTFEVFRSKGKIAGEGSGKPAAAGWPEPSPGILPLARKRQKSKLHTLNFFIRDIVILRLVLVP